MSNRMVLTDEEKGLVLKHREAEKLKWKPKLADDYTTTQKLEGFCKLHHMAFKNYHLLADDGHESKDIEHYMYEAVMELLGEDVWEAVDKLR